MSDESDIQLNAVWPDPYKLSQHLAQIDSQAGMLTGALGQYEKEFDEQHGADGWDWDLLLMMIYRSLPPQDLADDLQQALGGQAMLIMFKFINLTQFGTNVDGGPEIHQVLHWMAETMRSDNKAVEAMVADADGQQGAPEIMAWGLHIEGYGVSLNPGEQRPDTPFKDLPQHYEQRIIMAADRAGYRYSITRRRDNGKVEATVDLNREDQPRLAGRVIESLADLIDATPTLT